MRQVRRFWFLALGFCTAIVAYLLTPGQWLNRLVAVALCTVLTTDQVCLPQGMAGRAVAAMPRVEVAQQAEDSLMAQRSSEFDDVPITPAPSNIVTPPPYPVNPGPNFPVRRPDFDEFESRPEPNRVESRNNFRVSNLQVPKLDRAFSQVSIQSTSLDTYDINLVSQQGCSINIKLTNKDRDTKEVIRFTSANDQVCGAEAFTASIFPDQRKFEIILDKSNDKLTFEFINFESVRTTYQDSRGGVRTEVFPIPEELKSYILSEIKSNSSEEIAFFQQKSNQKTCEGFKKFCDYTSLAGGWVSLFNSTVGLPFLAVTGGAAFGFSKGIELALWSANWLCFAGFGGIPPISFPWINAGSTSLIRGAYTGATWGTDIAQGSMILGQKLAERGNHINSSSSGGKPSYCEEGLGINWQSEKLAPWLKNLHSQISNVLPFGDCSTHCDDNNDSQGNDSDTPIAQKRHGDRKTGTSYGDPHLITFDGFRYSFQTVGEFTLVKSTDDSFEVQTRQSAVPGRDLSMNTGVAIRSGRDRIAVYSKFFPDSDTSTPLRVNGRPTVIQGRSLSLPSGATIYQQGEHDYLIEVPTGEQVAVKSVRMGSAEYMNVTPSVFTSPSGLYTGLLGNLDGNPENDLRSRNGRVMPSRSTYGEIKNIVTQILPIPGVVPLGLVEDTAFDQIYKDFGNSWRVSPQESLFDYAPGQSTETFTDKSFPKRYRTLSQLSPQQIEQAERVCLEAGVEPDLLDGCIFDVGFTGEAGFAQSAANAMNLINQFNRVIPGGLPIPRLPVRIPGLPF